MPLPNAQFKRRIIGFRAGYMAVDSSQARMQQALDAIRQKHAATAITILTEGVTAPLSQQENWLLAQARRMEGDAEGEIDALHAILKVSDRDLPVLLAMGDAFSRLNDERAAAAWFRSALAVASRSAPPAQLVPLLQRAEAYCAQSQRNFTSFLSDEIAQWDALSDATPAMQYGMDMLMGRKELYLQQPNMFYYPGLPQRAFFERSEFDWVTAFEAQADAMRDEFLAISERVDPFAPYVVRSRARPAPRNPLLEDKAWGAGYLWQEGERTHLGDEAAVTCAALAALPQPYIPTRAPFSLWSRLTPGTHIQPHHGLLNTRLICHLPLVAPEGCALRVGAETRPWHYGELQIFDDSIEHEAWNRGNSDRTVLLFEIWRPEIPEADRAILTNLFQSINRIDPHRANEGDA